MNYVLGFIAMTLIMGGGTGVYDAWNNRLGSRIDERVYRYLSDARVCAVVFNGRWMTAKRMPPFCLGGPVHLGDAS